MMKGIKEKIAKSDAQMCSILNMKPEDMEHLKVETGMDYLVKKYTYATARQMWKSKGFWAWWRIIWHMNNMDILDWLTIEKEQTLSWEDYAGSQLAKSVHKYNLSKKEMRDLVIPGPPDGHDYMELIEES